MARKLQIASFLLATIAILGINGCYYHNRDRQRDHHHHHDDNRYAPGLNQQHYNH